VVIGALRNASATPTDVAAAAGNVVEWGVAEVADLAIAAGIEAALVSKIVIRKMEASNLFEDSNFSLCKSQT
jgi:hypothetical protein